MSIQIEQTLCPWTIPYSNIRPSVFQKIAYILKSLHAKYHISTHPENMNHSDGIYMNKAVKFHSMITVYILSTYWHLAITTAVVSVLLRNRSLDLKALKMSSAPVKYKNHIPNKNKMYINVYPLNTFHRFICTCMLALTKKSPKPQVN